MSIELLLSQVSGISKKYDLISQKTGGYFNIFEIANIEYDEVTICRVIYELLSPMGSHGQGAAYLGLFVKHVLSLEFDGTEFNRVKVYREYRIANDRRIDIAISLGERFIPIEVKLYAGDQDKQCYDYYRKAKKSDMYYLTLDGHLPSPESAAGLTPVPPTDKDTSESVGYEGVRLISFEKDIILWLEKCLENPETVRIAPIREVLFQLLGTVRKLTNKLERGMQMDIVETLTASKQSMLSAVEIEKSMNAARIHMLYKLFAAMEERIRTRLNIVKLNNQYDFEKRNSDKVESFYDRRGSTYPGISYLVKSSIKPGVDLWLRIEVEDRLFIGFCTPLNGQNANEQIDDKEIGKLICFSAGDESSGGWWIYWEYLPEDDEKLAPNFKYFNDIYYDLFDEAKFTAFIDTVVDRFKAMHERLK